MMHLVEIRQLKGTPMLVLMALMIAKKTVREKWLTDVTGLSDRTVYQALLKLEQKGLVVFVEFCSWKIADPDIQLPPAGKEDL
jgi:uncharacterized membrane protein